MAIVKQLVELMGGRIGAESTPVKAACFGFPFRSRLSPQRRRPKKKP